jgi:NitT/TauT family transport system permease protein
LPQAEGVFDTTGVFARMVVLAAWVLVVGAVMARLERRLLRWKPEFAEARWKDWLNWRVRANE